MDPAGRTISARIGPNEDLTRGVEKACAECGIPHAVVRMGIGSLIDGCMRVRDSEVEVPGPVVEIITLAGEVHPGPDGKPRAELSGRIGGPDGAAWEGSFVVDRNTVLVTTEIVLQEPQSAGQRRGCLPGSGDRR
jgi:predicted DNA-binding protein with PD1-like motif